MDHDMEECYNATLEVAKEAGVMIREAFSQEKRIETKCSVADLVTETDKAVEDLIINTLKKKFPSHSFIGEESVAAGQKCVLTDNPTWIIDPIDGTSNFVHRFPYVAVSIALVVNKKTEIGLVYNPILEQMFTARPGQGAFCNGERLKVTGNKDLSKSLILTEFGSQRVPAVLDSRLRTMRKIIDQAHGIRDLGAGSLHCCQVASGLADGYYHQPTNAWDIAAGVLIVTEAGGVARIRGLGSAALNMCLVAAGNIDAFFHQGLHCWDIAAAEVVVREAQGFAMDVTGSAAMSMVLVAAGNADAFYEFGIHCWDIAAGDLIVREAGGTVINPTGGPLDLMARRVLCASSQELADQIVKQVEAIEFERD